MNMQRRGHYKLRPAAYIAGIVLMIGLLLAAIVYTAPVLLDFLRGPRPIESFLLRRGETKTIVLVHGWTGSQRSWERKIDLIQREPSLAEWGLLVLSYDTITSGGDLALEIKAKLIADELRKRNIVGQIALISHSLGGVISRILTLDSNLQGVDGYRIVGIASFGSPHNGVLSLPDLVRRRVSPETLDSLKPGSAFLTNYQSRWLEARSGTGIKELCFYGSNDIVVSKRSATLGCEKNFEATGRDHNELIDPKSASDDVFRSLVAFIGSLQ